MSLGLVESVETYQAEAAAGIDLFAGTDDLFADEPITDTSDEFLASIDEVLSDDEALADIQEFVDAGQTIGVMAALACAAEHAAEAAQGAAEAALHGNEEAEANARRSSSGPKGETSEARSGALGNPEWIASLGENVLLQAGHEFVDKIADELTSIPPSTTDIKYYLGGYKVDTVSNN